MALTRMRQLLAYTSRFYFPEETIFYTDFGVRLLFSLYYLPIIAIIIAAASGLGLNIAFTLVVPLLQPDTSILRPTIAVSDELPVGFSGENPFFIQHLINCLSPSLSVPSTPILATVVWMMKIVPYGTLLVSVAAVCQKLMNNVVEAMVDAFSTYGGKDYALASIRFQFMLESRQRIAILVSVAAISLAVVVIAFFTNVMLVWSIREPRVLVATWIIIATQLIYVFVTIVYEWLHHFQEKQSLLRRQSTSTTSDNLTYSLAGLVPAPALSTSKPSDRKDDGANYPATHHAGNNHFDDPFKLADTFVERWWRKYIHRIRYFAMEMLVLFIAFWVITAGFLDATSFATEALMYLNLPHLFMFTVLTMATSVTRGLRSVKWAIRHGAYACPVFVLCLPYILLLGYCAAYFRFRAVTNAIFGVVGLWHLLRCIELAQIHAVGPSSNIRWKYTRAGGHLLSGPLAIMLEDAHERGRKPAIISLDVAVDLDRMTLYQRGQGLKGITREVLAQPASTPWSVVPAMLPRALILQSRFAFSGHRFYTARAGMRMLNALLLVLFMMVLVAVVIQTTIPAFRPLSVTVDTDGHSFLRINHVVVNVNALASGADRRALLSHFDTPTLESDQASLSMTDQFRSLCSTTFEGVSVWEMAWLSALPYITSTEDLQKALKFMHQSMGSDWEAVDVEDLVGTAFHWLAFVELRSAKHNVTVLSVRGTDLTSAVDMLQDINMYFDVVLYHLLACFVPGSSMLPSSLVADFIQLATFVERFASFERLTRSGSAESTVERHYYRTVERHLHRILSVDSDRHVLLTGHSLGGAMAHIVGARNRRQSVAFSAPGIMLGRRKYGLTSSDIHASCFTVIPAHDIVPHIGWQGGEVHHMTCESRTRELCHALEHLIVSMWKTCPTVRKKYPGLEAVW